MRFWFQALPLSLALSAVLILAGFGISRLWGGGREPIVVGVLHSMTGPMAASERGVIDATVLALEQINAQGGLLDGRPVRWIIADGGSDEATFAREAVRLIDQDGAVALFGCWTSASRKAVRSVVEKRDHILIYPVQYEGCEQSPNIFYLGAAPNQQIVPAVSWGLENLGADVYLVGSDYIFPRVANAIIRDQIRATGGRVLGEAYVPLGDRTRIEEVVDRIVEAGPDVILNTINGDTNEIFFEHLKERAGAEAPIPSISFSVGETELAQLPNLEAVEGHYAAWNYFQSLNRPLNEAFVRAFQQRYGEERAINDPMEAAYVGVQIWARAVQEAGNTEPREVRLAMLDQSLNAPEGIVSIDSETQHAWKIARIGRARADGQFEVVWSSRQPVRPLPYPIFRSASAWDDLVDLWYRTWGGRWSNPERAVTIIEETTPETRPAPEPAASEETASDRQAEDEPERESESESNDAEGVTSVAPAPLECASMESVSALGLEVRERFRVPKRADSLI